MSSCSDDHVKPRLSLNFLFSLISAPRPCNFDVQTANPDSASLRNPTVKSVSNMARARTAGKKSPSAPAEKRSLSSFHSSLSWPGLLGTGYRLQSWGCARVRLSGSRRSSWAKPPDAIQSSCPFGAVRIQPFSPGFTKKKPLITPGWLRSRVHPQGW